ncbi:MAG: hypothetical protein NVV69_04835 [Methyloversatilis sp.]|uniref:hypothetical protein n=1 Tax=Methyloversatilis sp. TaxID=2569862 RepID=UPI0025FD7C6D|nr:hypothetical protein [Methyloversatilis sp.]MCR6665339.1 hypothetical protein [Methyloversatilis sp.]
MNELDKNSQTDATPTPQTEQVDAARRRLTRGGAAGAGVLLSVASRSAFGTSTWGTCTGSEIASGNLSREGTPAPAAAARASGRARKASVFGRTRTSSR